MKILRCLSLLSAALVTVGCSTLDTSSEFSDAVDSIKERSNYVEVYAKSITPDTRALVGANLVKSDLTYVSVHNRGEKPLSKQSTIDMSVSYFKNYDSFHTAVLNGKSIKLDNFRPTSETCTEHCTVTQWLRFPFSQQTLKQFDGKNVTFTISSGKRNTVEVTVPKAYFEAVEREGLAVVAGGAESARSQSSQGQSSTQSLPVNDSKSIEMVQYWYDKATPEEKEQFAQFAIKNRKGGVQTVTSESQSYNMLQYWYSESSQEERSQVLNWLINQ